MLSRHPPSSEEHRSKRKFQPSITSYFEVRDDFEDYDDQRGLDSSIRSQRHHHHHHHHHHSKTSQRERLAPQVPGQVQADLLSVGMRIRKSVPEGYKTHSQKMTGLPTIQTTISRTTLDVKPPRDAVPDDVLHQRELLPFCGLHKIGGFAEQPTTNPHLYGANATRSTNPFPLPAEAFTQPFSSQSSTDSGYATTTSSYQRPHNPSKRSWQDDDDDKKPSHTNFFFAIPSTKGVGMGVEIDEVPVSPLSETPPPMGINMLPPARQMAQPKSRRTAQRTISDEDIDMDFENAAIVEGRVGAGCVSDFEEADFLAGEVDMGGV